MCQHERKYYTSQETEEMQILAGDNYFRIIAKLENKKIIRYYQTFKQNS